MEEDELSFLSHSVRSLYCCCFHQLFHFNSLSVASPYHRNTKKLVVGCGGGGAVVCLRTADKSDRKPIFSTDSLRCVSVCLCVGLSAVLESQPCCLDWSRCPLPVSDLILVEGTLGDGELAHWLAVESAPL